LQRPSSAMAKIVLSYRRNDTKWITGRIFENLERHFGEGAVFMDIDNVPLAADYRHHIRQVLAECDILIAVVGPKWQETDAAGNAWTLDRVDWVRLEISTALERGIPLVPLLIDGTKMPGPGELPDDLRDFAFRQAARFDTEDFKNQMQRLTRSLDKIFERADRPEPRPIDGSANEPQPAPATKDDPDAASLYSTSTPRQGVPSEDILAALENALRLTQEEHRSRRGAISERIGERAPEKRQRPPPEIRREDARSGIQTPRQSNPPTGVPSFYDRSDRIAPQTQIALPRSRRFASALVADGSLVPGIVGGIGIVVGLVLVYYGIPVKEFGFGRTLLVCSAVATVSGLGLIGLASSGRIVRYLISAIGCVAGLAMIWIGYSGKEFSFGSTLFFSGVVSSAALIGLAPFRPAVRYCVGLGLCLAGLVAVGFGAQISEFSFGGTLIVSGSIATMFGLVLIALAWPLAPVTNSLGCLGFVAGLAAFAFGLWYRDSQFGDTLISSGVYAAAIGAVLIGVWSPAIVNLVAGLGGAVLAGVLISLGLPIYEFSFGGTLIRAGAVVVAGSAILISLPSLRRSMDIHQREVDPPIARKDLPGVLQRRDA
jgi:TIR domain